MHIMKRRILYSLLMTATLGLSSCESFLSENPKDQITEEQAYQNSTLLYLNTVASLYTQVGANGGGAGLQGTDRGLYDLNTFTTDEAMLPTRGGDWYDGGLWQNLFLHNWGTKNDLVKGSWDYLYKVIAQTNQSLDKLKEIIADKLGVNEDEITMESTFIDDLGADSLDIVELIMSLEEELEIEIPDEDAEKFKTVGDVVEYINSHSEQ